MKLLKFIPRFFKSRRTGSSNWVYSIRTRLVATVMIMIIPIFFLGLFSYISAFKSIRQTAENSIVETIDQASKYFQLSLSGIAADSNQIVLSDDFIKHVTSSEDDIVTQMNLDTLVKDI